MQRQKNIAVISLGYVGLPIAAAFAKYFPVVSHCIGVDPYYLIRKAQSVGHNPELIRASRRINNAMGACAE